MPNSEGTILSLTGKAALVPIMLRTLCIATVLAALGAQPLWSQASEIPSAAPVQPAGQTPEQRGHMLLDEMVEALGGDAWLHRRNMQEHGRLARFFRGAPTGITVEFTAIHQFPGDNRPEAERVGFITDKSMILPGKKIDVVQIWTGETGEEITYKGKTSLPRQQVEDYYRRRDHSIEAVIRVWLKAPDVVVISEGNSMVERRLADKVTVLSANNDAVTIELDAATHLPLRRTFQWRNETFKDHDEDAEEYDDYHLVQGLPTAYTLTRYHNGDMNSQTFFTKFEYDVDLSPDTFTQSILIKKK
jgi:hypothetical protein